MQFYYRSVEIIFFWLHNFNIVEFRNKYLFPLEIIKKNLLYLVSKKINSLGKNC